MHSEQPPRELKTKEVRQGLGAREALRAGERRVREARES